MPKVDNPGQSGLSQADLSQSERNALQKYLDRGALDVRSLGTRVTNDLLRQYQGEISTAAQVAKAEFEKQFDGEAPQSGSFGVSRIRSGYFGYDSWDNCPDSTSGDVTTWIDNSTPDNLSGSGGVNNPAIVGDAAVHLVTAIGTHEQSPKAEAIRMRLNDQPRTSIEVEWNFRETDSRYKPLTTPFLLKKDDSIFAEFYGSADGSESLYFDGVTFIEEKDYRELDPANMTGSSLEGNIVVE
jgi:hypothetical protein